MSSTTTVTATAGELREHDRPPAVHISSGAGSDIAVRDDRANSVHSLESLSRTPSRLTTRDDVFAGFNSPLDPDHPHNWSTARKLIFVAIVNAGIFAVTFASGILGPAAAVLAEQHHVSPVVMQLGVSLYVAGFAVGPLVWGPILEAYGRNIPSIISLFCCGLCHVPLGLAPNVATVLVSRFLAGTFGACVMTAGAAMVSELYGPIERGTVLAFNALFVNLGSVMAPIVGSYIVARHSWRWLAWITLIVFGCVAPVAAIFLREAVPTRILAAREKKLRQARDRERTLERETTVAYGMTNRAVESNMANLRTVRRAQQVTAGPPRPTSTHSDSNSLPAIEPVRSRVNLTTVCSNYLTRPVALFVREPILIVLTIYSTFVYGLLYMAYQLFPMAYETRGWALDTATLPFFSVAVGLMISPAVIAVFMTTWYKRRWQQRGQRCTPEDRLPPMILGACVLPPALAWFGWTMDSHWSAQVLASAFIGLGLQLVFVSALVYIVDVYMANVVPAIAAHVVMRSIFAASFPLWTGAMYEALGVKWMATALAGFAAVMAPFPILFFIFGEKIRGWSRFSVH